MENFEKTRRELGLKCGILLEDFHHLSSLDSYIKLIENFLDGEIGIGEFDEKFCELRNVNCEKELNWKEMLYIIDNLKLKQFQGLSSIISKLFTDLDVFEADSLLREDYEINEKELRIFAKEALSKLRTYCD